MPIDEAGLMAAVNTGIAEAAPPSEPAPAATPPPETAHEADATPPAPAPDGAPAATGDGIGGDSESPAGDDGAPANTEPAAGTDVPADGAEPAPDKVVEGVPAEPAEAARKPDPLNDPLPNALKPATKERITALIGIAKETTAKLETVTRDRDDLVGAIIETKATPEQYGQALSYLKLVNSPSRADREQALTIMQQEVAALARMLGKPVPGVNMLEGHQDLIDEVSTGRISPERAQEIAASRNAAEIQLRQGQQLQQQTAAQEARQREINDGVQSLNKLGAALKARDKGIYDTKRAILVKTLKPVFARIPPAEWASTFQRAYNELTVAPPPPPPVPQAPATDRTPLRASNPAGAARPTPKTLQEAVEFGISEAR